MSVPTPHYLLYSASAPAEANGQPGDWRFVLEAVDGSSKVEIADSEPDVRGERLELLAVVRGLEALDAPSRVTLVTPSRYVSRGISNGLNDWRENGWQWERHGEMVPVKNRDLWQRVDRALKFHRVECRQWRLDFAHEQPAARTQAPASSPAPVSQIANESESVRRDPDNACAEADHIREIPVRMPKTSVRRFKSEPADERRAAASGSIEVAKSPAHSRRWPWKLRLRRVITAWLEKVWHRIREFGAPLFRAPWLD